MAVMITANGPSLEAVRSALALRRPNARAKRDCYGHYEAFNRFCTGICSQRHGYQTRTERGEIIKNIIKQRKR